MKEDYLKDLSDIRAIMERSSRFISLSGLSGILAGVFALAGAWFAYEIVYNNPSEDLYAGNGAISSETLLLLFVNAFIVLTLAIGSGVFFTVRRSKKMKMKVWDVASKRLLINLLIPLVSGGLFIIIIVLKGFIGLVAPLTLIFYGLALINASKYTLGDVRYLGLSEVVLGLIATLLLKWGLLFWAIGFGALHIIYGAVMYFKYER